MNQEKSATIIIERENFYQKLKKNPLASASADFVASVMLIFILFVVAIKPTINTVKNIQQKIDELTSFNDGLISKISILEKLTPIYQQNLQKIELLNFAIPDKHNFQLFEKQLRYLIFKNNLKLRNLSFSAFPLIGTITNSPTPSEVKTENNQTNSISIQLVVIGNYENIKVFISQLQSLIRIVDINSITIEKSAVSEKNMDLVLTINSRIYFENGLSQN